MIFKKLCLEDKNTIDKYISPYKFLSCEYSFTSLYIWKDACDIQYTIYKQALILKKKDFDGNYHFMQPLGYSKEYLGEIIEKLKAYREENDMKYLFKDLEESFIEEFNVLLNEKNKFCIEEDRYNFDYLYEAKKLMIFSGKKLHSKKNHYNAFIKTYNYEVVEINDERVINDVSDAAEKWYEETNEKNIKLYYELLAIKDIINNMNLLNLNGVAVYVDGKVAAFSIGESLNEKLAVIHIEKGDKNINGIYSFIAKTLIDKCFNNAEIINREQDLGIDGLRKSKMSYYPLKLEKKFILSF
ncbi:MAG TPA: phosphatidylglycerol lysyltransferase domain-containing protein [Clostridium sp.]